MQGDPTSAATYALGVTSLLYSLLEFNSKEFNSKEISVPDDIT